MAEGRLRVAIASAGRFHLLDLARQLDDLGFDVKFYSYVPQGRAIRFGLPRHCYIGLLWRVAPYVAWQRFAPRFLPGVVERLTISALERALIASLEPCDVFICLSGVYVAAAEYARRRFGACIFLERGSRHIHSQLEILSGREGRKGPSDFFVARELAGYELADRIVVPSTHVARSFGRDPQAAARLFCNPYGVDLIHFPQWFGDSKGKGNVLLFVGAWSYRKGADVLIRAAMEVPEAKVLHVGTIDDVPFPDHPRFRHVDFVNQLELSGFYAQASVFVLASREEGLAVVQAQALASGLLLICTDRTGGEDLAHTEALRERICVVPAEDVDALKGAIENALARIQCGLPIEPLTEVDRQSLSWRAYGERYSREILRVQTPAERPGNGS